MQGNQKSKLEEYRARAEVAVGGDSEKEEENVHPWRKIHEAARQAAKKGRSKGGWWDGKVKWGKREHRGKGESWSSARGGKGESWSYAWPRKGESWSSARGGKDRKSKGKGKGSTKVDVTGRNDELKDTDPAPIHLIVDKMVCGVVIGRGGSNLKEFQEESGASVEAAKNKHNDKRFIKIYGEGKEYALELILKLLGSEGIHEVDGMKWMEFGIPPEAKARVLGAGGGKIAQLRNASGAKEVTMARPEDEDPNTIYVQGSWKSIAHFGSLLNGVVTKMFTMDERSGTEPEMHCKPNAVSQKRAASKGSEPPAKKKKVVVDSNVPIQLLVDKTAGSSLLGPGGKVIAKIMQDSGAKVDIKCEERNFGEKTVTIKGEEAEKHFALDEIFEKLEEILQAEVTEAFFVIPKEYVPCFTGKNTQTLRKLKQDSGTQIVLSRPDRGEIPGGVHIAGNKANVYNAAVALDILVNDQFAAKKKQ